LCFDIKINTNVLGKHEHRSKFFQENIIFFHVPERLIVFTVLHMLIISVPVTEETRRDRDTET
jgi:hypothetical protein